MLAFFFLVALASRESFPEDLPFNGDRALAADSRTAEMRSLAREYLEVYKDSDQETYLDNRFRLEAIAGDYGSALKDLHTLRDLPVRKTTPFKEALDVQYLVDIEAHVTSPTSVEDPDLERAFRKVVAPLNDKISCLVIRTISSNTPDQHLRNVQFGLNRYKGKTAMPADEALPLLRNYFAYVAFKDLATATPKLVAEDDTLRYVIDRDVLIKTPDGATICATIVRPKTSDKLPALLEYSIYNGSSALNTARLSAGFGYVGVAGFTRGKGASPDKPIPYVYDGADAAALITWLSKQPWCDGQVGMTGGSYDGFTQWAAAKHMPKALKAMFDGASACPGIDVPMEGNVVWNFVYPWTFYTTDKKVDDDEVYGDRARWQRLDRQYYLSGRPYRDLDKIDGTPNPIWNKWVSHPTYDSFWQSMVPYKRDFSKINIPILTTAGYFYGGPGACAYYFREHTKYNPNANHYLVIGPWDHFNAQVGVFTLLGRQITNYGGYEIDPAAKLNLEDLKFHWFDHVLKGGPRPDLLQDRVNYQLTGSNEWKHAHTLEGMSDGSHRFYLSSDQKMVGSVSSGHVSLTVDLVNRKDIDEPSGGSILAPKLETPNCVRYISEPLAEDTDVSGFLSGSLDFVTNKRDFDFSLRLYEQRPDLQYFQVGEYWCRASSVDDITKRKLLTPGKRTALHFEAIRLMGHRCVKGSRLVVVLGAIKEVGREINYGSGRPVSEESIANAGDPLQIRWLGDSYVDVPIRRG